MSELGLQHFRIERRGEIAIVHFERPPANAIDLGVVREAPPLLEELAAAEPGAVVLTGQGGFFSAGADLKAVPSLDRPGQREMVEGINRLIAGWYAFPRPVVCAVNGHAIAGGLILALTGDHRICATQGKFGLTELRVGIPYPAAAMLAVRAELTPAVARRLVLRAELVDHDAALELGLVDELAPGEQVLERALEVATELAALPGSGYGLMKRQLREPTIAAMERAIAGGDDPLLRAWLIDETTDAAAGVLAREDERS
jgi:enoyl-CoA hydratase